MTIGFVFECGPQGADKSVCEYLTSHLKPGESFVSRTLDNKPRLLKEAPSVARKLLELEGCDRVLIVWDLRPAWPAKKDKPCRAKERQSLLDGLAHHGLANAPVYLVCVEQELESWVIACDHAITAYLSRPAHAYKAKRVRRPDQEKNPKSAMMKHFETARGWRYDDREHAVKVLKAAPLDLSRLRCSVSFERFEAKLQ
jgi:hypothetical protein